MLTVYEKLKELYNGSGISAVEIADSLGLNRANTSNDLNRLCEEGKVSKSNGRPVLFSPIAEFEKTNSETCLDIFLKENNSLFSAVEQAKAAILYPPKGMHILILGETGVGKSMFASILHKYAVEMNKMIVESPFIVFNCADYSNNPQLLIGQLFGTKKGAYTGADTDRVGLIEKANGGILFLDEVHRLPPEGQEMFFTFMDRGTFRRLGETELERKANVLIISATTEPPESFLLKTFTRRIPMVIHIKGLSERSIEERFHLIELFLREESTRLDREILLSVNSMRALLSYNCINNIGQLKTDIQLICAKAYADFVSNKKDCIKISSNELPRYIREGLYKETEHRQIWNRLIGINTRYCKFSKSEKRALFQEDNTSVNIYDMIDMRAYELKSKGLNPLELEIQMDKDIEDYFAKYIYSVNKRIDTSNLQNIIEPEILLIVDQIVNFSEERLKRTLSNKIYYGMAIHIASSINRVRQNKKIINPNINKIRQKYPDEFNLAIDCLNIIERTLDITMPIDEAGFLTLFLIYDEENMVIKDESVRIIVIAHGNSSATSMVDVANNLLGAKYAFGINAPLDEKPQQILAHLIDYIENSHVKSDILFLVDMGSLTTFAQEIENKMNIRTKTIPLVSTLHVIEAARKAMIGYSLEEIYRETLNVNTFLHNEIIRDKSEIERIYNLSIVTICTTGEGSAMAIKNFLEGHLQFDATILQIIPINLNPNSNIFAKLKNISKESKIVCVVTSFKLDLEIPKFDLDEVLSLRALKAIQNIIDLETTYIKMGETLKNQLLNVDGREVFKSIRKFIFRIEEELNLRTDTNILIGITLHIGCMIDRLIAGNTVICFEDKKEYIEKNLELYKVVKKSCELLSEKYSINISEDEICFIMVFFNAKDYY